MIPIHKILPALFFSLIISACSSQKSTSEQGESGIEKQGKVEKTIGKDGIFNIEDYKKGKPYEQAAYATFAGGCFWCMEGVYQQIDGIIEVVSGYSGGDKTYPTYHEVGAGTTQHAESIQIFYDPNVIDYKGLLEIFFAAHDPTQLNGQGPDIGAQYRSAIFYNNEEEKQQAESYIQKLNESGKYSKPVVTEISPYESFWVAEDYHQDYYRNHPENPYVQKVSKPKVEKVRKLFKDRLKHEH